MTRTFQQTTDRSPRSGRREPNIRRNAERFAERFDDEEPAPGHDHSDPTSHDDQAFQNLTDRLRRCEREFSRLRRISEEINHGVELEQVLDAVYCHLQEVLPYDRIGCALVEQGEDGSPPMVVARWVRSNRPMELKPDYRAPLHGTTLEKIIKTMRPRIINDLEAYLESKPDSAPTRRLVAEGMRSSLTCPLIVEGKPIGFLFFTSGVKNAYKNAHVAFFQQVASQLATAVEKGRLYSELEHKNALVERQNRAMMHDMETARSVQRALIPRDEASLKTTGLHVAFAYEPAQHVGGDILDVIPVVDGRVLFFIGDAMGHGVQAALVMSIVKTALIGAAASDPQPAVVLSTINRIVAQLCEERFVTAACCLVDAEERRVEVSLAGHPGPLVYRARTQRIEQPVSNCYPLGLEASTEFETTVLELGSDDAVLLFTDGIVETFSSTDEQYDDQRLRDLFLRYADLEVEEIRERIMSDVKSFRGTVEALDDMTLLAFKPSKNYDWTI